MATRRAAAALVAAWLLLGACTSSSPTAESPTALDADSPIMVVSAPVGDVTQEECETNPRWAQGTNLIVFLHPGLAQPEIDEVAATLGRLPMVESFTYFGTEEAFAEYLATLGELPRILEPEDLPTSFRVVIAADEATVNDLAAEYDQDDRVMTTVQPVDCSMAEPPTVDCSDGENDPVLVSIKPGASASDLERIHQRISDSGLFTLIEFDDGSAFRERVLDEIVGDRSDIDSGVFPQLGIYRLEPRQVGGIPDFLAAIETDPAVDVSLFSCLRE